MSPSFSFLLSSVSAQWSKTFFGGPSCQIGLTHENEHWDSRYEDILRSCGKGTPFCLLLLFTFIFCKFLDVANE